MSDQCVQMDPVGNQAWFSVSSMNKAQEKWRTILSNMFKLVVTWCAPTAALSAATVKPRPKFLGNQVLSMLFSSLLVQPAIFTFSFFSHHNRYWQNRKLQSCKIAKYLLLQSLFIVSNLGLNVFFFLRSPQFLSGNQLATISPLSQEAGKSRQYFCLR